MIIEAEVKETVTTTSNKLSRIKSNADGIGAKKVSKRADVALDGFVAIEQEEGMRKAVEQLAKQTGASPRKVPGVDNTIGSYTMLLRSPRKALQPMLEKQSSLEQNIKEYSEVLEGQKLLDQLRSLLENSSDHALINDTVMHASNFYRVVTNAILQSMEEDSSESRPEQKSALAIMLSLLQWALTSNEQFMICLSELITKFAECYEPARRRLNFR